MKLKLKSAAPQQERSPREGLLLSGLGVVALAAKGLGLLILAAAVLGFGFSLIRAATSYSSTVGSGQATAGIFFTVLGTYLGTFVGLAALGGLLFGAGIWLERLSTRSAQGAEKAKN